MARSCGSSTPSSAASRCGSAEVKRLMTIPGVDATVALSIVAAVGDFARFRSPEKLVSYLGLNPRVRQSGGQPASHGRITKQGRAHARGMLVEAAWAASKTPGPLRAFYRARPRPPRHADRRRRDRAQARGAVLAPDHQGRGLRVRAAVADRPEAAPPRAARRPAVQARAEGQGRRLLAQGGPRRARTRSPSRPNRPIASSSPTGRPRRPKRESGVAAANGARLSRPSDGATAARQDSAPDPALRSGVDHAHSAA